MGCGLLGEKLGHSYSPQIHHILGDYSYELFEKKPEELADFLENGHFSGLNVTIPYKKTVIPYCAELTERAKKLGAVNTIVRRSDGALIGHNTDFFGFSSMLRQFGMNPAGKKALVLGSGGASNTAVAVLEDMGANVIVISRSGENNYSNIEKHYDAALIVNATPVGMYPKTGCTPLPLDGFYRLEGVLDLIYNPARTQLLLDAEKAGIPCMNGLWMLVAQAWESAQLFANTTLEEYMIAAIHDLLTKQTENLVLIGMPGCGKSTIGKKVAHALGKRFVDADVEIERASGCSIPELFEQRGENGFRELETKVLSDLGKRSELVIATGGGCVTRQENYSSLHQNGRIIWIQRDISQLSVEGRPLSQNGKLEQMYRLREPMYQSFADHTVKNNGTPQQAADLILTLLEASQ
ncbi:MAG: shikimate kinase [Oscillospiraceae bacterium]|nr:shikimate kinase [Oscillospiraceae bacterium]